jgi:hypothetical protein
MEKFNKDDDRFSESKISIFKSIESKKVYITKGYRHFRNPEYSRFVEEIIISKSKFDADAQTFITSAQITDTTQQLAINTLVKDLKTYNLWDKMLALYPFVGGTAFSHKFNLKDPRDVDAAYRLTFSTGWTHSSLGANPNGVNAYADTKLVPLTAFSNNNISLGYYTRNIVSPSTEMGSANSGFFNGVYLIVNVNNVSYNRVASNTVQTFSSIGTTPGFYYLTRITSQQFRYYRNNSLLATANINESGRTPNSMWIGGVNYGVSAEYGGGQCSFSYISIGLTDAELTNLYNAVQTFQTTLSRQV